MYKKIFNINLIYLHLILSLALIFIISCSSSNEYNVNDEDSYIMVPQGWPAIPFLSSNPYNKSKVELGRKLFYDPVLSKDSNISCSHCHNHAGSFSDKGIKNSRGSDGEMQVRNTMMIANAAYLPNLLWDGRAHSIETIAYVSIPLRQDFNADTNKINLRLKNHPRYPYLIKQAFGEQAEANCWYASQAIAAFVRTLVTCNSRYDKFIRGDASAMNETEKKGMNLFYDTAKTNCSKCHSGMFFTDMKFHKTGYDYFYFDRGLYYVTGDNYDRGKFLTPSLRNVEVSYPYMHDGEIPTLEQVVEHYNHGGVLVEGKDPLIYPLNLSIVEKQQLVAFLKTLTDWDFINDKKYSKPE